MKFSVKRRSRKKVVPVTYSVVDETGKVYVAGIRTLKGATRKRNLLQKVYDRGVKDGTRGGAVRLAHVTWNDGVAGSNPAP